MIQLKNTLQRYGIVAQLLHWTIVALIITQFILADQFHDLPRGLEKYRLINDHKSFGMLVLMLSCLRLCWRWTNPVPSLPSNMPRYEITLAQLTHYLLYVLILCIPLSGWLMSSAGDYKIPFFDWFQFPALISPDDKLKDLFEELHEWLATGLFALAVIHSLAALKHHFINRDNILRRMLPFCKLK